MSRDCAYANHDSENIKLEKTVIDYIANMKVEIIIRHGVAGAVL